MKFTSYGDYDPANTFAISFLALQVFENCGAGQECLAGKSNFFDFRIRALLFRKVN